MGPISVYSHLAQPDLRHEDGEKFGAKKSETFDVRKTASESHFFTPRNIFDLTAAPENHLGLKKVKLVTP